MAFSSNFFILFVLIISCVSGIFAYSCIYEGDSQSEGHYNLTFICEEGTDNQDFFEINKWSKCPGQFGFYKFLIGTINFQDCKMELLEDNFLKVYWRLYKFDISGMGLTTLRPEDVSSCSLKYLNASNNQITKLSAKLFMRSNGLSRVDFSHNKINQIDPNAFPVNNQVENLDLGANNISTLDAKTFQNLDTLLHLRLSHNQIVEIPQFLFKNCKELYEIDLSFNEIIEIIEINPDAFPTENDVKHLNFNMNQIGFLHVNTFQKFLNLEQLSLANNQITEIPSFLFHRTGKLVNLDLSFNNIRQFDDFAFIGGFNLNRLNLSHNKLTILHPQSFEFLSNLTHLDVS